MARTIIIVVIFINMPGTMLGALGTLNAIF